MVKQLRVLSVFGTRPEAVKMAPVVLALRQQADIDSKVCVTAQHRQMLDQVLDVFQIKPDYDLNLMKPDQSLAMLSAAIFTHLDPILKEVNPDWILIQGDTTTVMVSAIAGYFRKVKIGHVEAGLRSHDKWAPFPEEINRRIAGVTADLHFAPTLGNRQNLLNEGVSPEQIVVTGNPAIDALHMIAAKPVPASLTEMFNEFGIAPTGKRLVLITAHRRENFGQPLLNICAAIQKLARRYADQVEFIYPVHLNPNVQAPVYQHLFNIPNVHLIAPLDYLPMVHMMKTAHVILTDSGGLQEEAPALGVPTLVLRETTERPEGVEAGTLELVGSDPNLIFRKTCTLLDDAKEHLKMANAVNPYGDGTAASKIVQALLNQTR